jgi:cytochrome c oxidase subunit 3
MDTAGNASSPHDHGQRHSPFLAHHFRTPEQQFAAGKLGMWLFLVTEVLLFGGLFCAYAVYRAHHPEIFLYAAEEFLDKTLGALNTAVLIFSSFTMAWAVRSAQLNHRTLLVTLLGVTLACGFVFLGVKFVEYEHKWKEGLLWASAYKPVHAAHGEPSAAGAAASPAETNSPTPSKPPVDSSAPAKDAASGPSAAAASTSAKTEHASAAPNPQQLEDNRVLSVAERAARAKGAGKFRTEPKNVGVFFSIYFVMTGLHGIHVIAGMLAIGWVLRRSLRGDFSGLYYGPVDFVGLYWHLVDLIWIFLFPLLYLIH